jgi:hypothetical protein
VTKHKRPAASVRWPHITALLAQRGHITVGYIAPIEGAAIAANEHRLLATVVRRPEEAVDELLLRLDDKIGLALIDGVYTNEVQSGRFLLAGPAVKTRKRRHDSSKD